MVRDADGDVVAKLSDDQEGEDIGAFINASANFTRAFLAHMASQAAPPVTVSRKTGPSAFPPRCPAKDVQPNMLRAARAFLDMDQRELAKGAGLSARTIATIEQGGGSVTARMAVVGYLMTRRISFYLGEGGRNAAVCHDSEPTRQDHATERAR